jgi:hypothetical protein
MAAVFWSQKANSGLNRSRRDSGFPYHKTTDQTGDGSVLLCGGDIEWQEKDELMEVRGVNMTNFLLLCIMLVLLMPEKEKKYWRTALTVGAGIYLIYLHIGSSGQAIVQTVLDFAFGHFWLVTIPFLAVLWVVLWVGVPKVYVWYKTKEYEYSNSKT